MTEVPAPPVRSGGGSGRVAGAAAIGLLALALLPLPTFWPSGAAGELGLRAAHLPLGIALAVALRAAFRGLAQGRLVATATALVLLALLEVVQGPVGRTPDLADALAGAAGVFLVAGWPGPGSRRRGGRFAVLAVVAFVGVTLPDLAGAARDRLQGRVLGGGASPWAWSGWEPQGDGPAARTRLTRARGAPESVSGRGLLVVPGDGDWAGISRRVSRGDWTTSVGLRLRVVAARPGTVIARIESGGEADGTPRVRAYRRVDLVAGEQQHELALAPWAAASDPPVDLAAVRRVTLFFATPEARQPLRWVTVERIDEPPPRIDP